MTKKRLTVGDISKLNIFRQADPDWMDKNFIPLAKEMDDKDSENFDGDEDEDDCEKDEVQLVQLRNALLSVPKNKFSETTPKAQYKDQLHKQNECKHEMIRLTDQRRAGDEEFTVIESCKLCTFTRLL